MSKMYNGLSSLLNIIRIGKSKPILNRTVVLLVLLSLISTLKSQAQLLAWQLNGRTGAEASTGSTTTNANLFTSFLTRGTGIDAATLANAFGSVTWNSATQAAAEAADEYFQFTVQPQSGYTTSLTNMSYRLRRSSTGPNKYIWKYSIDGSTFIDIPASQNLTYTSTATGGDPFGPIVLSGIAALQNVPNTTTITFRLYAWGASATTGSLAIGRSVTAGATDFSLVVNGTTAAGGPTINVTPVTLAASSYVFSFGPGPTRSFTVSGNNLTGFPDNINLAAPADYEMSLDNFATAGVASIDLPYAAATMASVTVYARLKAGLPVGNYDSETIDITGGGATTKTVTCDGSVTPFFSSLTDVVAVAASESPTISSLQNDNAPLSSVTGAKVWEFSIRDGGAALSDPDPLPTIVNSIVFATSGGNSVSNWAQAIKTIALFDGATMVPATVNITANQIQFTGMSLTVNDNSAKTLTVRLSLNCGIGGANSDGDDFGFSLSNGNFTTASNLTSSQKSAFAAASSTNATNLIAVVATELRYLQQPSASVAVNANFSPAVQVIATDVCGNIDRQFTSVISITSTGSMVASPQNATAIAGLASFPGIAHSSAGGPFTLNAASGVLTPATSSPFTVIASTVINSGDLMIVGFDTWITSGTDLISLANFVPMLPNTSFTLANVVYDWKAPANVRQDRWYNGNGTLTNGVPFIKFTYTGATNIATGSVICVFLDNNGIVTNITINGVGAMGNFTATTATGTDAKMNFSFVAFSSSAADAIFLMQGEFTPATTDLTDLGGDRYRTFTGTVFGGIQTYANFQPFNLAGNAGGSRVSRIYPSIECVSISTGASASQAFYGYYRSTALHTGTHRNLIKAIAAYGGANWTTAVTGTTDGNNLSGDNTCSNTFTVTTNVFEGLWTGEANTDWFDCNNWDDFNVPTSSTDVLITSSALNNAAIDNNSAKAAQFGSAAFAKTVNITGRQLRILNTGSAIRNTLNVAENLTINVASGLNMSDAVTGTPDGLINIGGNWTNNFTNGFIPGESLINFNSAVAGQVIDVPDGETFYDLENNNTNAGVSLDNNSANLIVSHLLTLNSTSLAINTNTLTLNGTVAGAGSLSGNATSNLLIGGTTGGNAGTINFGAGGQLLNNLTLNRTGVGGAVTLGTPLSINGLATITAGTLDAGANTLDGTGGLTMTAGELQLGKTGATLPELTGTYTLTGGVINFKGAAAQTIRGINYFNLTSTSTGTRAMQNGGTVGIASTFTPGTNTYTFTGSTVDYNGTGAQNIAAFTSATTPGSSYNNLTLSNAGVKSLLNNTDVEGDLSLNNTITLAVGNRFLNLKSFATQTARVAPVSASANITYGTGRFVVERYFPGRRAWRLITAPVSVDLTKTIFNSWQLGGNNAISGSGTFVTGPNPVPNGLDVSPLNNYSLKRFNQTNSQFDGVGNTKGANLIAGTLNTPGVPDNRSFFMFVRGDRTPANTNVFNIYGAVNSTTLRDTGRIQTQSYTFDCNPSVGVHRYTLIGNPYASPVDFASLSLNNVLNKFQAWDPQLNTVGGYVTVDLQFGLTIVPVGSSQTQIIQSKQAFIVETSNATSPTVTFGETAKSTDNNLSLFRPTTLAIPSVAVNLNIRNADGTTTLADGILAQFRKDFDAGVDHLDGVKFGNVHETFSIQDKNDLLMLSRRPMPVSGDSIFFNLRRNRQLKYQFNIIASDLNSGNLSVWLADRFLGTSTPVNLNGNTAVDFSVTSNAASAAGDRFYLYFKRAFKFNRLLAQVVGRDIALNWSLTEENDANRYEIERSSDGENFTVVGTVNALANTGGTTEYSFVDLQPAAGIYYYRVKGITNAQAVAYTETARVKIAVSKSNVYVYPNPVSGGTIGLQANALPAGVYSVKMVSAGGQIAMSSQLVHASGTATENIAYPASIAAGTYQLELVSRDRRKYLVSVVVEK